MGRVVTTTEVAQIAGCGPDIIIYWDLDGVLVNFTQGVIDAHRNDSPDGVNFPFAGVTESDITIWNWYEQHGLTEDEFWAPVHDDPDFWVNLEAYQGAKYLYDRVEYMCKHSKLTYEIKFCTTPSSGLNGYHGKPQWLLKHGYIKDGADLRRLVLAADKSELAKENRMLIDDRPGSVEDFVAEGGYGYLYPRPWNCESPPRTNYIHGDLLESVREFIEVHESKKGTGCMFDTTVDPEEFLNEEIPGRTEVYEVHSIRELLQLMNLDEADLEGDDDDDDEETDHWTAQYSELVDGQRWEALAVDMNELMNMSDQELHYGREIMPVDSAERKKFPVFHGFMEYFPLAIAACSRLSWDGNEKHNSGMPLHWSRDKSNDHKDCLARHMLEHEWVHVFWRAAAILQIEEEERLKGLEAENA